MSEISTIGLGLMGTALARTLHSAGHTLTVWNRSPEKMASLVEDGARGAKSLAAAVEASPVVLVCVNDYGLTEQLFSAKDVLPNLKFRTIIQLSTGSPKETLHGENWFNSHGAHYLDGAILGGPTDIGTETGQILVCGKRVAWDNCKNLIKCLAGNLQYLGENIRAATTLDLAWLTQRYGLFVSVAHAIRLCEAEGVSAQEFADTVATGNRAKIVANVIQSEDYTNPTATLSVWKAALSHICHHAHESKINSEFPDLAMSLFERAENAGYGEEDVSALIKILRNS